MGGIARELERGRARFFVRPRVMLPAARSFADVQRLFLVLEPEPPRAPRRRIVIGRKRMPDATRRDKEWAYVDAVGGSVGDVLSDVRGGGYETKTEGWRTQAGPSEIARGTYAIRPHDDHVHLDYALDEAPAIADVGLVDRASMIVAVFNPEAKWRGPVPSSARRGQLAFDLPDFDDDLGGGPREPTIYPDELQEKFGDKRFAPLEPAFLDHVGCELVLIGHEARIDEEDGDRSDEVPRLRSRRGRAGA